MIILSTYAFNVLDGTPYSIAFNQMHIAIIDNRCQLHKIFVLTHVLASLCLVLSESAAYRLALDKCKNVFSL